MHIRSRLLAALLTLLCAACFAAPALATPVATSDGAYQVLGRVFPDPMGGCRGSSSPCSPNAQGNLPATQFIGVDEFTDALKYMNSKPEWQRYMEVWPLDGKLDESPGSGESGTDEKAAFPGNNLGAFEFTPKPGFTSAGLATPDLSRQTSDLIAVRVTDETVPDQDKKRYALSLSIHGIERAGAEGGIRAMEDIVTAYTTKREGAPVVPKEVQANAPTFADVLKQTIIYFTLPNPDGWRRGSVSSGGVFFQRYNGNGIDPNRDWPDLGAAFRGYSSESEPETKAWISFYKDVREKHGPFAAGDDLHGQPQADALSYTLMPHGSHDFGKDLRIRETSKLINRAQYEAVKWSPIIQDNDKPVGGGAPCVPGALGDACAKIYAQTWGSVYDTINYTTTGALGDWFDSAVGLNADGIDNEMSFSHLDKNITFDPHTEQLHVDGNKSIIYAHLARIINPVTGEFDAPGAKGYVPNARLKRAEQDFQPAVPAGTSPQETLQDNTPDGEFPFEVKRTPQIYSGGLRVEATAPNAQGVSSGMTTLKVQCKGCDTHREPQTDEEEEWVTVAEDFNQSPLYAQAGVTAAVNRPQASQANGKPVEWRALVEGPTGIQPANVRVVFTQGPATSGGATGGDDPPKLFAFDVANTDFFSDLNRFIPGDDGDFKAVDPKAVISGDQSLDGLSSLALADDPLPGYTGPYGPPLSGTTPAEVPIESSPTAPGAYGFEGVFVRKPGTFVEIPFEIKAGEAAGGLTARIDWATEANDFDMYLYAIDEDGTEQQIGSSTGTQLETKSEEIKLDANLAPGKFVLYVDNFAAADPSFAGKITFRPVAAAGATDTGAFTPAQKDVWFDKLEEFARGGGNLVLTDGALRALGEITSIPPTAINTQTVYAGQVTFQSEDGKPTLKDPLANKPADVAQPGARFNSGMRRQTYEPTPLGFPIQTQDLAGDDKSFARQYDVSKKAFTAAGGRVAGTSANSGARDAAPVFNRVALGEIPFGNGDIRIIGGLLPQPTQQFDHEFGLAAYATTYTGYIVARNLFEVPLVAAFPGATPEARTACAASSGFRRAAVKPLSKGRRLRFDFTPNTTKPVTVDVFQTSTGRRVLKERLVARFTNRRKAFTWNGKANGKRRLSDGQLFVRYRMKLGGGKTDDRRFALRRAKGKLAKRPDYYGKATCNVLSAFKLERPAFGGRTNRPLNIAFRLRRSARVAVTVYRGKKVVSKLGTKSRKRNVTYRVKLGSKNLRVGDYRVQLTITEKGKKALRTWLTSRRI